MNRKARFVIGSLLTIFCVVFFSQVYVHAQKTAVPPSVQKAAIIDTGNELCPVTGDKADGVHTYTYNGKSYNLCCGMCAAAFEKDPAKYAAIADAEVKAKK